MLQKRNNKTKANTARSSKPFNITVRIRVVLFFLWCMGDIKINFKEVFSDRGGEILKEGIGFHFSEDVLFYLCVWNVNYPLKNQVWTF